MTLRNFKFVLSAIIAALIIAPNRVSADTKQVFHDAITAVEKREYSLLSSILEEHPQVLDYLNEQGDSLFIEFLYVMYEDPKPPLWNSADLEAIGHLLGHGANPHKSNGLLASLLTGANNFSEKLTNTRSIRGSVLTTARLIFQSSIG